MGLSISIHRNYDDNYDDKLMWIEKVVILYGLYFTDFIVLVES